MPPVVALASKARPNVQRSSRIGFGGGTTPFGIATATVMPLNGNRSLCANDAVDPSVVALSHGRVEPNEPWKHAVAVIAAGAWTETVAWSMITAHSCPIAFQ